MLKAYVIIGVRLEPEELLLLDAWRDYQQVTPSRSAAVRYLLKQALQQKQKKNG